MKNHLDQSLTINQYKGSFIAVMRIKIILIRKKTGLGNKLAVLLADCIQTEKMTSK